MIWLDRAVIAAMIPHTGRMCLLDGVLNWDAAGVRCVSWRYGAADNPLRRADGTLGTACGIELACQAMALHGRLTCREDGPARPGVLVSLRDVQLGVPLLDAAAAELLIEARLLTGDAGTASYNFTLTRAGTKLLSGRAAVVFGVAA